MWVEWKQEIKNYMSVDLHHANYMGGLLYPHMLQQESPVIITVFPQGIFVHLPLNAEHAGKGLKL
jgi:hypothetical protein